MMWRVYIFRKRLTALRKVRCTMRPRVFWWRFNHQIRKKRQAAELLKSYLSARIELSPIHRYVRQYCHAVRKVQHQWRVNWSLLMMQLDISQMYWIAADEKRGVSHTAAVHVASTEQTWRVAILREDLRQRKAEHMVRMLRWRKAMREYEEWLEEEKVYAEARQLMQLSDDDGKHELQAPARTMPPRPIFTLFGPPGHFKVLHERMVKKREEEKKRADREWMRMDSMRMSSSDMVEGGGSSPQSRSPARERPGLHRGSSSARLPVEPS